MGNTDKKIIIYTLVLLFIVYLFNNYSSKQDFHAKDRNIVNYDTTIKETISVDHKTYNTPSLEYLLKNDPDRLSDDDVRKLREMHPDWIIKIRGRKILSKEREFEEKMEKYNEDHKN